MKEKYIFLSSARGATQRFLLEPSGVELVNTWGQVGGGALDETVGAGGLSVDVDELDRDMVGRKISALAGKADVFAFAPVVPMKLIAPVSIQSAAMPPHGEVTWGVKAVGADTSALSGNGIVVAVLDTGIDAAHPAFSGIQLVQEDFTGEGNGDNVGHGTHCAGTIFGRNVDGTRIGVAQGVKKALIGKVLGKKGGSSDWIVAAVQWAMQNGANVISMSLGIDFPGLVKQLQAANWPPELATSRALEGYRANVQLFERLASLIRAQGAFSQPAVIVAAAGNESRRDDNPDFKIAVSPPAVAEGIISVAALGQGTNGFKIAPFSNTGANVSGPGVGIVSAGAGGGVRTLSGTSMATPHVAGVAALWAEWLTSRGSLNSNQLTVRLTSSGETNVLESGYDPLDVGFGLVRAPQSADR